MERQFTIQFSIKTPDGFIAYAEYTAGKEPGVADELFSRFEGSKNPTDDRVLFIDLLETVDDLPVKVRTLGCTLDEMVSNFKLITVETFRLSGLKKIVKLQRAVHLVLMALNAQNKAKLKMPDGGFFSVLT